MLWQKPYWHFMCLETVFLVHLCHWKQFARKKFLKYTSDSEPHPTENRTHFELAILWYRLSSCIFKTIGGMMLKLCLLVDLWYSSVLKLKDRKYSWYKAIFQANKNVLQKVKNCFRLMIFSILHVSVSIHF